MENSVTISEFDGARHHDGVVELWKTVFAYTAARNDPAVSIRKKLAAGDGLFFVAEENSDTVVGTVMAGYDGHRGWIYSLAVASDKRGDGTGRALMGHVEQALEKLGCVKVNLQIVEGNAGVSDFYAKLGYSIEPRISMGKQLGSGS